MGNLHNRLMFDLGKPRQTKSEIPEKELFKSGKIQKSCGEML